MVDTHLSQVFVVVNWMSDSGNSALLGGIRQFDPFLISITTPGRESAEVSLALSISNRRACCRLTQDSLQKIQLAPFR